MAILGLILGCICIFGSFLFEGGKIAALLLIPAMTIVFGGTAATVIIGTPKEIFMKFHIFLKLALLPPKINVLNTIEIIVDLSTVARREGILSLEEKAKSIEHPFFKKMIMLAVDGIEPEVIKDIAENEITYIGERHNANAAMFVKMGGYSPTMGIIGTVMGLISTLANAGGDANELVKSIATAFIATLWGVFMANIVWLPIGDRLKAVHSEEKILLEIIVEGVASIQSGENPTVTKMKLFSMLPGNSQKTQAE
jgi:chemotaxis protein MotA